MSEIDRQQRLRDIKNPPTQQVVGDADSGVLATKAVLAGRFLKAEQREGLSLELYKIEDPFEGGERILVVSRCPETDSVLSVGSMELECSGEEQEAVFKVNASEGLRLLEAGLSGESSFLQESLDKVRRK